MDIQSFLDHLVNFRRATPETIKAYRSDLVKFGDFLKEQSISRVTQVNAQVIKDYIVYMSEVQNPRKGRQGLSEATKARRLAAVSSYCDFVRANGHHKFANPLENLNMRWKRNNHPKPVDEKVLDQLLGNITSMRDRTLITLFLASGLRINEMWQLNRDTIEIERHIGQDSEVMYVGSGEITGKGDKKRRFFIDSEAIVAWGKYLSTREGDDNPALFLSERKQRMSVRAMQERLAYWCKLAGVEHIHMHQLRHTYATRLANANINSMLLKELMGHSSFTTTMQYFKLTDTTLARNYHAAMEFVRK